MPRGKHRTLQNIQNFIRKKKHLRQKLLRDLENLRIVKEADVECAAYYHLRRYIGEDPKWRVLARKHVRRIGRYVDLLIFEKCLPVIAIELKWNRVNIEKKDRDALDEEITKLKVQEAYWLSAVYSDSRKEKFHPRPNETFVLRRIIVRLGFTGEKLDDWKKKRAQYGKKMAPGKGHK
jgi:hypothetical protein